MYVDITSAVCHNLLTKLDYLLKGLSNTVTALDATVNFLSMMVNSCANPLASILLIYSPDMRAWVTLLSEFVSSTGMFALCCDLL